MSAVAAVAAVGFTMGMAAVATVAVAATISMATGLMHVAVVAAFEVCVGAAYTVIRVAGERIAGSSGVLSVAAVLVPASCAAVQGDCVLSGAAPGVATIAGLIRWVIGGTVVTVTHVVARS